MYRSNDCVKLIKQHLRNYNYYMMALENMAEDIACKRLEMNDESIRAIEYDSVNVSGGSSELNTVERSADIRIQQAEEIKDLMQARKQLQKQVEKLDKVISQLPDKEKTVVKMFYIDRMSYASIEMNTHYGERQSRRLLREAELHMAILFYGMKADDKIFFFD